MEKQLLVGVIVAAHGVHGAVKVKIFTENPADFLTYAPYTAAEGAVFALKTGKESSKGQVICKFTHITTREAAEAAKGTELFVALSSHMAGLDSEEALYGELPGMAVSLADGTPMGTITGVFDNGAHAVLAVTTPQNTEVFVPYTADAVSCIDRAAQALILQDGAKVFFEL